MSERLTKAERDIRDERDNDKIHKFQVFRKRTFVEQAATQFLTHAFSRDAEDAVRDAIALWNAMEAKFNK